LLCFLNVGGSEESQLWVVIGGSDKSWLRVRVCHHLYAYDKQAYESIPVNNVSLARQTLERSISDITSRCVSKISRRLQLAKLTDYDLTLNRPTGTAVIRPLKSVRDLRVHLDSELTMKTHISKAVSCCYHQLRRIRQVRRLVGSTAGFSIHFIATRLLQLTVVSSAGAMQGQPFSPCSV